MGFLDNSTNNVILDAVLTDKGRELLANGVGNFQISKFAFADDEVDYNIIQEFGRTVGKEKIEKNTPVLEACTTGYLGIKYRCLSLNNNSLSTLPILELSTSLTNNTATLHRDTTESGSVTNISITINQKAPSGVVCDPDLTDYSYRITCDNLFLSIAGAIPDSVDNYNIATYTLTANSSISSQNTSKLTFTLQAKGVSGDIFDSYATNSIVSRVVTVSGYNSGQFVSFNTDIK